MPLRRWITSLNNAIEGILYATKTQRHLRYHLLTAGGVVLGGYILGVTRIEFIALSICAMLVILAEMLNTVIERIVDRISPGHSEFARTVKDMAAGAVLITAFGSALAGYVIIFPYLKKIFSGGRVISAHSGEDVAVLSLVVVLIIVILLKAYTGRGTPLRGGFPSGHAAIAFSIWLSLTILSGNLLVCLLTFILAVAISQSRVAVHAHTPLEVVAGAIIGLAITGVLFLLLT